jgi:CRISPR-associated protein Csx10
VERLSVTIEAQSPLCFSERRPAGQFRESTEYVPGSALRGAVADLMVRDGLKGSAEFRVLFEGERPAVFTNAYPAPYVLPATAISCKAEGGLLGEGKHGVVDTLIERLCFEALEPGGLLYAPKCGYSLPDGGRCEARMEQHAGFYHRDGDLFRHGRVNLRLLTRVAINRRRAVAEDELLYSPIVISEGSYGSDGNYRPASFQATVTTPAGAHLLSQYLGRVGHLGSGASRGLGQVRLQVEEKPVNDAEELGSLRQRLEELNTAIRECWNRVKKLPGCGRPDHSPEDGTYFTIDLYSDAVLKEDGWLPTMVLSERMLRQRCKVNDDSLRLVRAYSGCDYRGGWNVAWGLPKDVDLVVPRGSVFLFWTRHPDRWVSALLEVERWGIGERTAEGFGQVRICDEFHVMARRDHPV